MNPEAPVPADRLFGGPSDGADSPSSQNSIAPFLPPVIPDHELIRLIGRGSYGQVWLAKNAVGTLRAIKVVYRSTFEKEEHFEREFNGLKKFEPISRSHDGFVDILQLGRNEEAGCFYYVMELADRAEMTNDETRNPKEARNPNSQATGAPETIRVSGFGLPSSFVIRHSDFYTPRTLRDDLRDHGHLPLTECLSIGAKLASALEHLHAQGLVHRDIKPSNIIFVNGEPKLADIGLVTNIDDAHSMVGTVGYIPPEGPGSTQADIYSLGKVLYEIVFGKDRQDFPQLPADLQSHPDHTALLELNEVITKACDSDPRQRYANAAAMQGDLALLRRGQSVKQKRATERCVKIVKSICAATALFALVVVALSAFRRGASFDTPNPSYRLSKNPLANKEYSEGVQCCRRDNKEGLAQARDHFNRAIEIDPKFTMACNGLFEVYISGEILGLSRAETWARLRIIGSELMKMDPTLAEAQAAQAWLDFLDWKWDTAEPRFLRAIQLNPKCAIAHMRYGFCLFSSGRPDEGLKELQTAELLDPTLPRIKKNIGNVFYVKRDFREAIKQYQKAIDLEPSYTLSHKLIACSYRALNNYTNAIDEFENYDILAGKDRAQVEKHFDEHRRAYADSGPRGYWSKCLEEAQQAGDLPSQARCYAKLNDYDQAFVLLEKAYATNEIESLELLLWDECWDAAHTEPRFIALLKKTGLRR